MTSPDPWTDARLEPARSVGDPIADSVVAELAHGGGLPAVNAALMQLVRNDQIVPESLPPSLQAYLRDTEHRPAPGEVEHIRAAERFFGAHGVSCLMLLGFKSLPWTYSMARGARVLTYTARLTRDVRRRIFETLQFVMDAMAPGGLDPGGRGIRNAQKVRLMHAMVRHYVTEQPDWDSRWGVPINQEDLAGTLCSFSTIILDGLERIGDTHSAEDQASFVEAWKVVGRNLGIREDLILRDPADGRLLQAAIQRRQSAPSEAGKELAAALVGYLEGIVPGHLLDFLVPTQMRFFIGDDVGDRIGLRPSNGSIAIVKALSKVDAELHRLLDNDTALEAISAWLGRRMLTGLEVVERGGTRPPFRIPPTLRAGWGLPEHT